MSASRRSVKIEQEGEVRGTCWGGVHGRSDCRSLLRSTSMTAFSRDPADERRPWRLRRSADNEIPNLANGKGDVQDLHEGRALHAGLSETETFFTPSFVRPRVLGLGLGRPAAPCIHAHAGSPCRRCVACIGARSMPSSRRGHIKMRRVTTHRHSHRDGAMLSVASSPRLVVMTIACLRSIWILSSSALRSVSIRTRAAAR